MSSRRFEIHPPYRAFYALSISFCTDSASRSIEAVAEIMEHLSTASDKNPLADIDSHGVLNELQNIIVQGAAVSRYFWPTNPSHESRGEDLRKQYRVVDDSPLKSHDLRNMIEHFDEKLDKYLENGIVGYIIPHFSVLKV